MNTAKIDDQNYTWAAFTLRTGMMASFAFMVVGLAWWFLAGSQGGQQAASHVLPLDRLPAELLALNPLALLNIGVLLLLATPGITLIAQFVAFCLARNWLYAGICAFIAIIIMISLGISLSGFNLF